MKVLFISLEEMASVEQQGIYSDLLRTFVAHGHEVSAVYPVEKRTGKPTAIREEGGVRLLQVATGNIQKTNVVEKGVSLLRLGGQLQKAIGEHLDVDGLDLVLFATPPTTIAPLVRGIKEQTGARAYLLLKDIFPQNSVDLGMLSPKGLMAPVLAYFKGTERRTYEVADFIGCMSPANTQYLLEHEPWLDPEVVEVNPNSLIPKPEAQVDKPALRERFGLPADEPILTYGGNLGKPQAIDFLARALELNEEHPVGHFVIAGSGTEQHLLDQFFASPRSHATLLPRLGREEFDRLLDASDVGIVLLDHRFTIPNFPSRVLSYAQASLPIVVASDDATDMGRIGEANGFGLACDSIDERAFLETCAEVLNRDHVEMGKLARRYLEENWTSEQTYQTIVRHFND